MITKQEFEEKKKKLISDFLEAKKNGQIGLQKNTSNLFRDRQTQTKKINVRNFNNVIDIDEKNMIADVEGMTTYEDLVNETLKKGFIPTVVPELKSITIGGAYSGGGIESSSFRYGLVHETIIESEILLASGETVICTATNKYKDLFFSFPNSYGTLGYVLRLKVKLVKVKPFVKLNHIKCDQKDIFSKMAELIKRNDFDFIDASVFSQNESYITIAKFVDSAPYTSDYTYMKIYFQSISKKSEDYLTILDYIWRWDTDWFWCSKNFYVQNKLLRLFWGRKNLNSKSYTKIMRWYSKHNFRSKLNLPKKKWETIIQDVEIPQENALKFLEFFENQIGIFPFWICPMKLYDKKVKFDLYTTTPDKIYFNFGFWDGVKSDKAEGYYNKLIEEKVSELNGKKSLYSSSYFNEKDFWSRYNGEVYFKLKKKYDPNKVFLNLYEKTVLKK